MSGKSLNAPEWRQLSPAPDTDIVLYLSPRVSSGTGSSVDRGTDLLAHTAPGGAICFYLRHWSKNPGETGTCQIITEDSARSFLLDLRVEPAVIRGLDRENIAKYLPGLHEHTGRVAGT